MKKLHVSTFVLILALVSACGTTTGLAPKSGKSGFDDARTVKIQPHANRPKSQLDFPMTGLGAQWNEASKDSVILIVEVSGEYTGIVGAELNIDGQKITLTDTGSVTDMFVYAGIKKSTKGFSTDLEVVRKILGSTRTWLRVRTPTGTIEHAIIDNGKDSKAYNALKRFIAEIDKS